MNIRVRRAGPEDLAHILRHRRAMFLEMGFHDEAVLDRVERVSREYFFEALRGGNYAGWLAEEGESRVVGGGGVVLARWPGCPGEDLAERAWILNLYTEPEARRRGVAKQLLKVMMEWCGEKGFRLVSLHASAAGRSLYETVGFRQTNEMSARLPAID